MIASFDFISDLLAFLDMLLRVQLLDTPIWKLKLWWPKGKAKLGKAASSDLEAYPRLKNVINSLKSNCMFDDLKLLEGWLVVNDAGPDGSRFTWKMREPHDIKQDRQRLALDMLTKELLQL